MVLADAKKEVEKIHYYGNRLEAKNKICIDLYVYYTFIDTSQAVPKPIMEV